MEPQIRAAVLAGFSFDARDLGQPAYLSEAIAMMQAIEGVLYVNVRVFDSVSEKVASDASRLSQLVDTLKLNPFLRADLARLDPTASAASDPCTRIRAAELVFMTPDIPDMLILSQIGA